MFFNPTSYFCYLPLLICQQYCQQLSKTNSVKNCFEQISFNYIMYKYFSHFCAISQRAKTTGFLINPRDCLIQRMELRQNGEVNIITKCESRSGLDNIPFSRMLRNAFQTLIISLQNGAGRLCYTRRPTAFRNSKQIFRLRVSKFNYR